MNLIEKLFLIANENPNKIAIQIKELHGYRKLSYQELCQIIKKIAGGLLQSGIKSGDKVAIILENCPEWIAIYFAILLAGGIVIPIDTQASKEDCVYFLEHSQSKMVFTSREFLPKIDHDIPTVLVETELDKFCKLAGEIPKFPKVTENNIAAILYTSGTTGVPKGVVLTHKNFLVNFLSVDQSKVLLGYHNILSILPLHHSFPFMATMIVPLFTGNKITQLRNLSSEEIITCMQEIGITALIGVPQVFTLFYKSIMGKLKALPFYIRLPIFALLNGSWGVRKLSKINLSKLFFRSIHKKFGKKLRLMVSGGAKLNTDVELLLNKLGFTVIQGYGLTETAPVVTLNPLEKQKIGSAGKVVAGVEAKIVNPDRNGIGEVVIKGANVMQGYDGNPTETAKVIKDNWFYSGDYGYFDAEGYLFLTGRKKEMIVLSSGKNITPEEVEEHYMQSKFIQDLCVLSVKDKQTEEKLMAVVHPDFAYFQKVHEVDIQGTIKWELDNLSKNYPAYKRIMGFVIAREEFPKTRLGKLKRFAIQQSYTQVLQGKKALKKAENYTEEELQLMESEIYKTVIKTLQNIGAIETINLNDHLEIELGFDSLSRIELMATIEKMVNMKIKEEDFAKIFTVKELVEFYQKLTQQTSLGIGEEAQALQTWREVLASPPKPKILDKINLNPNLFYRFFYAAITKFSYVVLKLFFRLQIIGLENIPRDEPFILCPNHASYLDGFIVGAVLPKTFRDKLFALGESAYFTSSIFKYFAKLLRVIPVDTSIHLIDAMQACSYVIKHQKNMCIFPSGVRSIDGSVQPFKKGAGILAKELNIPLIPVYIKGSYEAWPRSRKLPRPHPIAIIFGKPVNPEDLETRGLQMGAKNSYQAIALAIREEVIALS